MIPGDASRLTVNNPSALYLQFTSIKASTGTPRTLKAASTTGTIPVGFGISATAGTPVGAGDAGSSNGIQTIYATPATIITGI